MSRACAVEGCNRLSRALGLCSMHYKRQKKHGRLHRVRSQSGTGWFNDQGYRIVREDKNWYVRKVREHIAIAEKALGRLLPPGAVVHHVNGVRSDNRPSNLVICPDNAYHLDLHKRALRKGAKRDE